MKRSHDRYGNRDRGSKKATVTMIVTVIVTVTVTILTECDYLGRYLGTWVAWICASPRLCAFLVPSQSGQGLAA